MVRIYYRHGEWSAETAPMSLAEAVVYAARLASARDRNGRTINTDVRIEIEGEDTEGL